MAVALALVLAAMIAVDLARRARDARRAALRNRAMHELRRPLQSLSLAIASSSPDLECARACLEQAGGALEALDGAVNGRRRVTMIEPTTLDELLAALERRWRHRGVEVLVPGRSPALQADSLEIGGALDNLVANSLTHGSGPVRVQASAAGAHVRVEILDRGPGHAAGSRRLDPRHGHGLGVAAEAAANHGGSLEVAGPAGGGGTVAALSLPCGDAARLDGFRRGPAA